MQLEYYPQDSNAQAYPPIQQPNNNRQFYQSAPNSLGEMTISNNGVPLTLDNVFNEVHRTVFQQQYNQQEAAALQETFNVLRNIFNQDIQSVNPDDMIHIMKMLDMPNSFPWIIIKNALQNMGWLTRVVESLREFLRMTEDDRNFANTIEQSEQQATPAQNIGKVTFKDKYKTSIQNIANAINEGMQAQQSGNNMDNIISVGSAAQEYIRTVDEYVETVEALLTKIQRNLVVALKRPREDNGQAMREANTYVEYLKRKTKDMQDLTTVNKDFTAGGSYSLGISIRPGKTPGYSAGEIITPEVLYKFMRKWAKSLGVEARVFEPHDIGYIPFWVLEDGMCFVPGGFSLRTSLGRHKVFGSKGSGMAMSRGLVNEIEKMRNAAKSQVIENMFPNEEMQEFIEANRNF